MYADARMTQPPSKTSTSLLSFLPSTDNPELTDIRHGILLLSYVATRRKNLSLECVLYQLAVVPLIATSKESHPDLIVL